MTPLNIAGQDADATRHCMITIENASGGTEARKLHQFNAAITRKNDLRNEFKSSLFASTSVDVAALGDLVVLSTADTAANDLMQEDCPDASIDLPATLVAPILRYRLLSDADLRLLPPIEWRIKDVLPSQGMAVVFGPSGSGKSFLVLDMLQSLALGHDWFGRRVKPCSVTYVALEGEAGVARRVDAYRMHHGSTSPKIQYLLEPFSLRNADDINDLVLAIKTAGTGDVVVLDTLSRATAGLDENDSKDMGQIVAAVKLLQELIGGLVILVHHTGKDASKGMRGHSLLHAALDCAIEIKRNGDHREWGIAKSKDGEDGAPQPFKLEIVPLGTNIDGDVITSCVIVANQSAQAVQKKMRKLGSNQTIAYQTLVKLLNTSDDVNEGAPPGRPGVRFDDAIVIVATQIPTEAKYQKERAKDAIGSLVGMGLLVQNGEWLTHNQSPQH